MNYKLIVFDLDGTLVDTIPDIADVFNIVLRNEGYTGFSAAEYTGFIGWGIKRTLELVLPEGVPAEKFERMLDAVIDEYAKRPARLSRVYSGIPELLEFISSLNVPMIVYTNKMESIAQAVVDVLFPRGTFNAVLGKSERFPSKPNPSALLNYLEGKDVKVSSILMVGDTPIDLETASNGGVSFAGASWGFKSAEVLEKAGSALNFPGPSDLHRWLMK